MHEVLTGGKHPLFVENIDNSKSYKDKIAQVQKLDPDVSLSWLAKNLFTRLTKIKSHQRYTAEDALNHPWITRQKANRVPENITDKISTVL